MAYFAIVYQSSKNKIKNSVAFLLFRVVEIHRICETTATPDRIVCTGRCQPERNFRTIRGFEHYYSGPLKMRIFFYEKCSGKAKAHERKAKEKRRKKEKKNGKKTVYF